MIDDNLFAVKLNPFQSDEKMDDKNGSFVVIFSVWKMMVGTAVSCLPWAFQQSGLLLSLMISTLSFLLSWYSC